MKYLLCLIIGSLFWGGCHICQNWKRENLTNVEYSGEIAIKYIDTPDKASYKIKTTDGSSYHVDNGSVFETITPGDSIIKKRGTLRYCLIKKDTVIYYYPQCYGIDVKDR